MTSEQAHSLCIKKEIIKEDKGTKNNNKLNQVYQIDSSEESSQDYDLDEDINERNGLSEHLSGNIKVEFECNKADILTVYGRNQAEEHESNQSEPHNNTAKRVPRTVKSKRVIKKRKVTKRKTRKTKTVRKKPRKRATKRKTRKLKRTKRTKRSLYSKESCFDITRQRLARRLGICAVKKTPFGLPIYRKVTSTSLAKAATTNSIDIAALREQAGIPKISLCGTETTHNQPVAKPELFTSSDCLTDEVVDNFSVQSSASRLQSTLRRQITTASALAILRGQKVDKSQTSHTDLSPTSGSIDILGSILANQTEMFGSVAAGSKENSTVYNKSNSLSDINSNDFNETMHEQDNYGANKRNEHDQSANDLSNKTREESIERSPLSMVMSDDDRSPAHDLVIKLDKETTENSSRPNLNDNSYQEGKSSPECINSNDSRSHSEQTSQPQHRDNLQDKPEKSMKLKRCKHGRMVLKEVIKKKVDSVRTDTCPNDIAKPVEKSIAEEARKIVEALNQEKSIRQHGKFETTSGSTKHHVAETSKRSPHVEESSSRKCDERTRDSSIYKDRDYDAAVHEEIYVPPRKRKRGGKNRNRRNRNRMTLDNDRGSKYLSGSPSPVRHRSRERPRSRGGRTHYNIKNSPDSYRVRAESGERQSRAFISRHDRYQYEREPDSRRYRSRSPRRDRSRYSRSRSPSLHRERSSHDDIPLSYRTSRDDDDGNAMIHRKVVSSQSMRDKKIISASELGIKNRTSSIPRDYSQRLLPKLDDLPPSKSKEDKRLIGRKNESISMSTDDSSKSIQTPTQDESDSIDNKKSIVKNTELSGSKFKMPIRPSPSISDADIYDPEAPLSPIYGEQSPPSPSQHQERRSGNKGGFGSRHSTEQLETLIEELKGYDKTLNESGTANHRTIIVQLTTLVNSLSENDQTASELLHKLDNPNGEYSKDSGAIISNICAHLVKILTRKQLQQTNKKSNFNKPHSPPPQDDRLNDDDEIPSSAVELNHKEKYIQKLNRQERVIEEVKLALKPHYQRKSIDKDEYKEILRKAVPKVS